MKRAISGTMSGCILLFAVLLGIMFCPMTVHGDCSTGCTTTYGTALGSNSGNTAYSNCKTSCVSNEGNYVDGRYMGMKWQCVEYARRWWYEEYGVLMGTVGYAYEIWDDITAVTRVSDNASIAVDRYANGGTNAPRVGDFLVYNSTVGGGTGHVAVIVEVNTDSPGGYVRVAEQNWNNSSWSTNSYARQLSMTVSGNNYTVSGSGIYGWKRSRSVFQAQYVSQSASLLPWRRPGETISAWIKYKNVGTATWDNYGGVSNPNFMELRSVDGTACNLWSSTCAYHSSWINNQRIGGFGGGTTPPNATATFNFTIQMPNITGTCRQYTAPWATIGCVSDWGGAHFTLQVDGTPPNSPGPVIATPSVNNVNSFAFSWAQSGDSHSGLAGYYWSVNGGTETFTGSTSLAAGAYATQQGANTFTARAVDNAGNSASASVAFTWNVGPCSILLPPCGSTSEYSAITSVALEGRATDWLSIGLQPAAQLSGSDLYSVGFWYRTASSERLQCGIGSRSGADGNARVVFVAVEHPIPDGEWHQFWSGPIRLPADLMQTSPAGYYRAVNKMATAVRDFDIRPIE